MTALQKVGELLKYLFAKNGTTTVFTVILFFIVQFHEYIPDPLLVTILGVAVTLYTNLLKSDVDDLRFSLENAKRFVALTKETARETFMKVQSIFDESNAMTEIIFHPRKDVQQNGNPPKDQN